MKNIKTIMMVIGSVLFLSAKSDAQKGTLQFNLNYNYGIPLGSFNRDLVKNASPRGAEGSLMYFFNDKLSAGLETGYQDYYQKYPRNIYSTGKTEDVSAVLTNSIQMTPVLVKAKYFPMATSRIKPYVSLGAGANLINFNQYLGEFGSTESNVGFLAQGGLGVVIPFGRMSRSGINLAAAYNYAPYTKYGYNNLNSLNVQAGVVFALH